MALKGFFNGNFNPESRQFERAPTGEPFSDTGFKELVAWYYGSATEQGSAGNADSGMSVSGYPQQGDVGVGNPGGGGRFNPYRAGSSTAKKAALFNTFLRSEGREGRRSLLGRLVHQLQRNRLNATM